MGAPLKKEGEKRIQFNIPIEEKYVIGKDKEAIREIARKAIIKNYGNK